MPARYKYALVALSCLLFFFLFSSPAYSSDVVINEFLADLPTGVDESEHEWVELYNKSNSPVDLSGWVIKDAIDSHTLIIENISIGPKDFVVVRRNGASLSLNNSSDEVRLFTSTSSAIPIDTFSYSKTYTNKSWGRIPDGSGDFVNQLIPSAGSHNQAPTPQPTPTPTSEPSTQPSSSPTANPSESDSKDVDDDDEENQGSEEKGVVAGYKTTNKPSSSSTRSADLRILPISAATFSAIEIIEEENTVNELGKSGNIPIALGSGFTFVGIVAYLHKRYNIISELKKKIWKKTKS